MVDPINEGFKVVTLALRLRIDIDTNMLIIPDNTHVGKGGSHELHAYPRVSWWLQ